MVEGVGPFEIGEITQESVGQGIHYFLPFFVGLALSTWQLLGLASRVPEGALRGVGILGGRLLVFVVVLLQGVNYVRYLRDVF